MKSLIPGITGICALVATVSATNTIAVREQEFVDSVTTERFMIIGVDYQPGGQGAYGPGNTQDPLSNATACLRDAALMQQLGINTIRSYNVDPTLNHDECASIFNSIGIYMIIDVNSPLAGQSIDRTDPSGSYNIGYLTHIFSVVESFKSYPNTLGFFMGNEIISDIPTGQANPPYIRAVQRDLKNYIALHAPRTIPVGYSAADVRALLQDTWAYLQCDLGDNGKSRSDFLGLNSYSWCGPSATFATSTYSGLVSIFSSTSIPVFFSEYGCIIPPPRYFNEVQSIYGPQMTEMSGGLVYQWTQDPSNYGLVSINSDGSANLLADYNTLQGQYNKLNITLLQSSNATAASVKPPMCSSGLISGDGFANTFNIPPPPSGAQQLISSGISNPPAGSIVPVSQTKVQVPVYAVNGDLIANLEIKGSNDPNTPSGTSASTSGSSSTGASGAAPSAKKTGAAVRLGERGDVVGGVALGALFGFGMLAL